MKKLLYILIFCFVASWGWAATYYISESTGSTGNSGTSGSPWKELDRIEDETYSSGDVVLLMCGDTWSESAGDWGAVGDIIDLVGDTNLTIGAYYLDGGTPRQVDGSSYFCSDVSENDPIIDGNVSSGWGTSTFYHIFKVDGGCSGITFQDIKLTNYYRGIQIRHGSSTSAISNITIQRMTFDNFGQGWIYVDSNPLNLDNISNVIIQDSTFTKAQKQYAGGAAGWGNCITIQTADNTIIRRNNIGQCNGEGVNFRSEADDGEVYENVIWDVDGGALKVTCVDNVVYRHNFAIHTGDSVYWQRSNAGLTISSESDTDSGVTDPSNNRFYANVVAGFMAGLWVNDGQADADSSTATNYVYNNTFIDNGDAGGAAGGTYRLPTSGDTSQEFEVEIENNLSAITDTTNGEHYAYGTVHANINFGGNAWDTSNETALDTDYCNGNCNDGTNDYTGDADLVDSIPCGSSWRGCASYSTPTDGDAALDTASDFLNIADNMGANYDDCLDPSSSWVDSVATLDQDDYGAGWEFGAYVDGEGAPPDPDPDGAIQGVTMQGVTIN